jgi:hypothetical protein
MLDLPKSKFLTVRLSQTWVSVTAWEAAAPGTTMSTKTCTLSVKCNFCQDICNPTGCFDSVCAAFPDLVVADSQASGIAWDYNWANSTLHALMLGIAKGTGPATGWATPQALVYPTNYPTLPALTREPDFPRLLARPPLPPPPTSPPRCW